MTTKNEFVDAILSGIEAGGESIPEIGKVIEAALDVAEPLAPRFAKIEAARADENLRRTKALAEIAIEMQKAGVPTEVMLRFFPEPKDEAPIYGKLLEAVKLFELLRNPCDCFRFQDGRPDAEVAGMILSISFEADRPPVAVVVRDDDTMADVVAKIVGPDAGAATFLVDAASEPLEGTMTVALAKALGRLPVKLSMEIEDAETEEPA